MATSPELYLSLLSGHGDGDVSHISSTRHNNIKSRKSDNRLMDFLDALATICVHKEKGEIFFVSLTMDSDSTTLHISSNQTVPVTVIHYLEKIRGQLKQLRDAVGFDPAITTSTEISTNPNETQQRRDCERELQKTIYEHAYPKLRHRFLKRAPAILKEYSLIMDSLKQEGITTDEDNVLEIVRRVLQFMDQQFQSEKPPVGPRFVLLMDGIASMCMDESLKGDIMTRWDALIYKDTRFNKQTRKLSLKRLLEKICPLYRHFRTISRVAWSRRLSSFLNGTFQVIAVPANHHNISIIFSRQIVLPITFPEGNQTKMDVQSRVYDTLMERMEEKVKDDGLFLKKGTELSKDVNVHAECMLLSYHLQHPNTTPYRFFGGSKLSCHGCSTFFTSYNRVAESLSFPRFFTRASHNKIYLPWACPSLLSAIPQIQLQNKGLTLDTQVREEMVGTLGRELAQYVEKLREREMVPSPSQSDSTDASGDSRRHRFETLELLISRVDDEFPES